VNAAGWAIKKSKKGINMFQNAMLTLVIVANISLLFVLLRLSVRHRDLLTRMKLGQSVYGFIDVLAKLLEFILKRKYVKISDPLLTMSCIAFIVSFLISIPLMLLAVIFHG
jgi:hypothetical protein